MLMLEVAAEATCNPAVMQILRDADRWLRAKGAEAIRLTFPELSEEEDSHGMVRSPC